MTNYQILEKCIYLQIQETKQIPKRINSKTPKMYQIKIMKTIKKTFLKATKEKVCISQQKPWKPE